jgi:hypothetical protein
LGDRIQEHWRALALGTALLLLGAGALALSFAYDEPVQTERLGRNAPVNAGAPDPADISANNSPTLARSPTNPRNLVVANRIDSPRYSCGLHTSSDAGATWSQTPVPAPARERICYAPDIAFGRDGTLYMSFVTLRGAGNVPNAVWLTRSTDGGKTFSKPEKVHGKLAFQVRLAADPRERGRLYMTWVQGSDVGVYSFGKTGNPIQTMRSEDGGTSWERPVQTNSPVDQRALAPTSAVGPEGNLYVLYLDLGDDRLDYEGAHEGRGGAPYSGHWKLAMARSRDRGATWTHSNVDERIVPTERIIPFIPPFPSLSVDGQTGDLYAAYEDARLGDPDVWVWSLPQNAGRWQGPTRVNDTPERDRTAQYRPKVDVAPDGRLDVLYYDRRADRRNVMNEVSLQASFDGGESFTSRLLLSNKPFDSRVGFGFERDLPDIGSRLGLESTGRRALAVWTDTRAGTTETKKQDLAQAVVAFTEPKRLSGPVETALRFGGAALALLGILVLAFGLIPGVRRLVEPAARR